ncbi:superoxide dismutase family protein [uncultured Brevundimonas sp.]|uniref:superoxide dismutase family protein n=1 Tax=uncultured Brevundimonas sp. TaxID=213418 RepID=UPI00260485E1|nr:superoxide dismutase family protein [uncultured Brevundimonas sp.]
MKKTAISLAAGGMMIMTIGCAAVAQEQPAAAAPAASAGGPALNVALINNDGQPAGSVQLKQGPSGLLMIVEAQGLTPGWHGIHLHATGQCEANFTSAGSHINHATAAPHGLLNPQGPDLGDLPNIYADASGVARAELFTDRAALVDGTAGQNLLDADGSAIVIHANADDHVSQPIGGAGARVACGIVKAH